MSLSSCGHAEDQGHQHKNRIARVLENIPETHDGEGTQQAEGRYQAVADDVDQKAGPI